MIIYFLYTYIIKNLIYFLSINETVNIIKFIFYESNNNIYFIFILLGILIKELKLNKIKFKNNYKLYIFIFIDIIKIIFIKYSISLILLTLIISIINYYILNIFKDNKSYKIINFIAYIILPISSLYITNLYFDKCNKSLLVLSNVITIILSFNMSIIFNLRIDTYIKSIILLLLSYGVYNHKKRRNILCFFMILYLIYYTYLI